MCQGFGCRQSPSNRNNRSKSTFAVFKLMACACHHLPFCVCFALVGKGRGNGRGHHAVTRQGGTQRLVLVLASVIDSGLLAWGPREENCHRLENAV